METMTTITIERDLLEQVLKIIQSSHVFSTPDCAVEIRAALAAQPSEPEKCGHCGRRTIDPPWTISPAAQPSEPEITTESAVKKLCDALRNDLDYSWSWHCNIAMMMFDAGCPHDAANEGAARFIQLLSGVDTRKHPGFARTQNERP